MRSVGLLQALSPVMDVARDARPGTGPRDLRGGPLPGHRHERRVHTEDAGDDLREGVLATAKHFLGYAVTEAGQNMAATAIGGTREFYDVYARPFEAAIRLAGQVPVHHGQKTGSGYRRTAIDIHKGYIDMPSTPLFAFGHGLSYTTFDYGPLQLESETVDAGGELRVSLTVTNTGSRRGTEVVQLYAADTATGVTLPAQQLIGFARLDLERGVSRTVAFTVPMSVLGYTGLSGEFVIEPGPVEVSAGSSSSDIRSSAGFTVTGETRSIRGEDRAFLSVATVSPPG